MFRVVAADTSDLRTAAILDELQATLLPADTPADTSEGWWWIVWADCEPVGFAGMYASTQWGDAGYLCRAGVAPKFQGHHLQRRLIRARERQARKLGWKWVLTDTYSNPRSANNLIACGYSTFTPSEPWGGDGGTYWKRRVG